MNIILALVVLSLAACTKSNDDNVNPDNKVEQVSGNWTVSYFFDSGKDETSDFSGYSFDFNSNGVLTASGNGNTFTGAWWIGSNSSDDDNSSNKLNISITGNYAMDELQDDWLIESLTSNEIRLRDDGDDSDEVLHFTR
jgi:hypothetical protein